MTAETIGTAIAIGAVVGILPGLFGVGGGFLMVPLLHVFAGVPINLAVGSCACQSLGSVTTGMLHRRSGGDLFYHLSWAMLPGTILGLELGIRFLEWTKTSTAVWQFVGRDLPMMETTQLLCYLGIMLVLAGVTALETHFSRDEQDHSRVGLFERAPVPPRPQFPEIDGRRASLPLLTLLAVTVGFLNGGFGMGGALLLVPSLVFLVGLSTHRAVAVTLVSSFLSGFISVASHAVCGNIDLPLVCWLLLGGTVGARFGSQLAMKLTGRKLRRYFAWVILASTSIIVWRLYKMIVAAD